MRWRWIWIGLGLMLGIAVFALWNEARRERRFLPVIESAAARYGVDPLLVRAVIWRESHFNPAVRGTKGEIGLMQIQELAAREWAAAEHLPTFSHDQCLDPLTNALAGTYYLGKLLRRYSHVDDPVPYALADYNAGRGNVLKWTTNTALTNGQAFVRQIGFPGTRSYVKSVRRRYRWYRFIERLKAEG